ncbi:hypothetical protein DPMN_098801 [Dreissena polymorpha]|uniref:Uncharacterized protein n=1 Tax=Dreissena polymorpha TaxID=45954 RepID=A0A9D4LEG0_DREPO|nr:hypothetical protein DPMN_098801 [Dreissena polymorpha]
MQCKKQTPALKLNSVKSLPFNFGKCVLFVKNSAIIESAYLLLCVRLPQTWEGFFNHTLDVSEDRISNHRQARTFEDHVLKCLRRLLAYSACVIDLVLTKGCPITL